MLKISKQNPIFKNLTFIHIPKNAGTSLSHALLDKIYLADHNTDFNFIQTMSLKSLIVIRDPLQRFCSGVNYHIKKERDPRHNHSAEKSAYTNLLIKKRFMTPDSWVEALKDKNHELHQIVLYIISKPRQFPYDLVNGTQITSPWHFAPQHIWIRSPTYVMLFENLEEEFHKFCSYHLKEEIFLPHKNRSFNDGYCLKEDNARFINSVYRKDLMFYQMYKNMPQETRLISGINI